MLEHKESPLTEIVLFGFVNADVVSVDELDCIVVTLR